MPVILVILVSIVHAPVLRNAVASDRSTDGQHAGAAEGVDVGVQDRGVPENGVDVDLGRKQRGTERYEDIAPDQVPVPVELLELLKLFWNLWNFFGTFLELLELLKLFWNF
jgi:hypothetical protein